jgi:peptide/nickel transport system substrate-binding protein
VSAAALGGMMLATLCGCMPRIDPGLRKETLIYLRAAGPSALDPAIAASTPDAPIEEQVYERLVRLDPNAPGLVAGQVAQSWRVSADGRAIDFALAAGHRFSDGTPVDAAAVKFSLDRVQHIARRPSGLLDWLGGTEVTGPMSVRLHLSRPFSPAVQMLSQAAASIVSPSDVRAHDHGDDGVGWLSEHSAGSGPYRIAAEQAGESVILEPNRFLAAPIRRFRRVEYRFFPDEGVRRLLMERGDADVSEPVSAAFVARYRALPHVQVAEAPSGPDISYLLLNNRRGLLADVRLRQAIAAAIDYRDLREKVLKGEASQLPGFLTPGAPGFDPSEPPPSRDLARARRLVAEAGYRGQPLRFLIGQVGPVSEFIQSNLTEAGLNVRLERRAPGATSAAKTSGDFDLIYEGWNTDTPDAGGMLEALYATRSIPGGLNASRYSNPDVDRWIDEGLAETDERRRADIFRRIDAQLRRDRPMVMIFAATPVIAHRDDIVGLTLNPLRPFTVPVAELDRRRP